MNKTVLYISYDGATDPLGQSQIIPYIKGLAKLGYSITLLSSEKKDHYRRYYEETIKTLEESEISWVTTPFSSSFPVLSPLINLRSLYSAAKRITKKKKIGILHCRSYMAALIGLKLKKKYGSKFLFDMRGFWADERIEGGIWDNSNPIHFEIFKFFKRREIEFLKEADYTVCLTENAKQEISSWKEVDAKRLNVEVIPCCADLRHFSPDSIKEDKLRQIKKESGIDEKDFVISYIGSTGTWYMPDEMLDFFKQLLLKKSNARFLFITPDKKPPILKKARLRSIDESRIIIVRARRAEVPYYLATSRVAVFFIHPSYSKKASSPTKMAEIMGMGIPIICNTGIGDIDRHIVTGENGYLIEHFATEDYQKAIDHIDKLAAIDKPSIRKTAEDHYAIAKGIKQYEMIYKKLLFQGSAMD